jgi:hypothetical protein
MPVIPELGRWRKKDYEFEGSRLHRKTHVSKTKTNKKQPPTQIGTA